MSYGHVVYKRDWYLKRISDWKLKFCFLPHRCALSKKRLWLTRAYKGIQVITGPGDPVIDVYWVDKEEFILWQLKK